MRAERAVGWLVGAYLFVLWGELLLWDTERWRVHPSDAVLAAAFAAAAPALWRARRRWLAPIPVLAVALAASLIASTLAAGDGTPVNIAGRLTVQVVLVIVAAGIWSGVLGEARAIVERAAVALALVSTAVTLVGGVLGAVGALEWLERWMWKPAFTDRTGHPLFGTWPRLVGGFSFSAEACGLWSCAAAAVLLAARRRTWILAAVAAIATLSIAGAAIVFVAAFAVPRQWRAPALGLAAAITLALQWPVHRAGPTESCAGWVNHRVVHDGRCETRYAVAKEHSIELFEAHPVIGAGASEFRRYAMRDADNAYRTTHGAWHGIAAEQGLIGLALALALAGFATRAARRAPLPWPALLAAFAAASIDLDVHKQRLLWLALGAVAGHAAALQRDDARAEPIE